MGRTRARENSLLRGARRVDAKCNEGLLVDYRRTSHKINK